MDYSLLNPFTQAHRPPPTLNHFRIYAYNPHHRKQPQNLRNPRRRAKLPPEPVLIRHPLKLHEQPNQPKETKKHNTIAEDNESAWSPGELEAITLLFERKIHQKPIKLNTKPRPLPLPSPHKTRPATFPTPKHHIRAATRSSMISDRSCKNPEVLIGIARSIGELPLDVHVSEILDEWLKFLRKGSLSTTIRELGHMGLPERALQTFCWAQKHRPALFPDDRILASTVEVLARNSELKTESELEKFLSTASRNVIEAMAKGFISAGDLSRAHNLLVLAKDNNQTLGSSIYAKLILESGKNSNGYELASTLLKELGEREVLDLEPQDCTAVMKVCIKLRRFEAVENLFNWFKESGRNPTVVMYTTVIHSRFSENKYREALALVWEMEELNCLLDLPAYRVVIRLCVALHDLDRAVRYFSRLKEAGFIPTSDIYRNMIQVYGDSGRLAKCKQICKEVEMAGLRLDKEMVSLVSKMEGQVKLSSLTFKTPDNVEYPSMDAAGTARGHHDMGT